MSNQLSFFDTPVAQHHVGAGSFAEELAEFTYYGKRTELSSTKAVIDGAKLLDVPTFTNEFWTSRQRAAHSMHEISYRACFKPQLPRFFIERLTHPGDRVYDPFMGRGTTVLEAALLGRRAAGCDVNPLSAVLVSGRLQPPTMAQVESRLKNLELSGRIDVREDLLVFYHPETLKEICALRAYLLKREASGTLDSIDRWIRMVAVNRLTGHSTGFFSVYTLPPNQAVSVDGQRKINAKRQQVPSRRDVKRIIAKKTASLLADATLRPGGSLSLMGTMR
ncbi:MAG: DNA methyltransferase [Acidobacteriota bacterium]|nr:DNA methyltransferase [Acidobacteriota bacterium]